MNPFEPQIKTPEERLEEYKAQCKRNSTYIHDYSNPELEELVQSPDWDEIQKQLTPAARKTCKSYFRYIADRSFGCLDMEIRAWESLVEGIKITRKKMLKAAKKTKK